MEQVKIKYNKPTIAGAELQYMQDVLRQGHISGDGKYTKACSEWFERDMHVDRVLLTHSCTAALEMAALLANIQVGDEVIMPSFTFVSTANAVVLRGGVPVFVDIRSDTLNINEDLIEAAITPRTKAIFVVHYAGVSCEMEAIMDIAERHGLIVLEDAAQAIRSKYNGEYVGGIGAASAFSFHETKNIISGEGGALALNDPDLIRRAEIIREKGTNRSEFFRGEVDKYTWVDIGSSYLPSELVAAFLFAQLEKIDNIIENRIRVWNSFNEKLKPICELNNIQRPHIPSNCQHNGHIFYLLFRDPTDQDFVRSYLNRNNIGAVFHYIPLHSSPYGKKVSRTSGSMNVTDHVSSSLLRLPLWSTMQEHDIDTIVKTVERAVNEID